MMHSHKYGQSSSNLRHATLLHCTLQSAIMRITSQAAGGLKDVSERWTPV